MIDIGVTKLAIIGGIALIVIGPEKLPGLARTVGTLLGRARRYVADVKDEVNRSMDLDELKKMKDTVESAVRDLDTTIQTHAGNFDSHWSETTGQAVGPQSADFSPPPPAYKLPHKKWRVKQGATPNWYKARAGIRTRALSGAARVARFRPRKVN